MRFPAFTIVLFSIFALLAGGCSSVPFTSNGQEGRFEKPQVSATKAAAELEKRLNDHQRELNTAREQVAAVEPTSRNLKDPELEGALVVLRERIERYQVSVTDLTWRLERAQTSQKTPGSNEDFADIVRKAPSRIQKPAKSASHVLKAIDKDYTQVRARVDALTIHLYRQNESAKQATAADTELRTVIATDELNRASLKEEENKLSWRLAIAQIADTNHSQEDFTWLLTQPALATQPASVENVR